jgi:hypothetical protein
MPQTPKPENILITKGREGGFSPAKPDNLLKRKQLKGTVGNTTKCPTWETPKRRLQAAETARCVEKSGLGETHEKDP